MSDFPDNFDVVIVGGGPGGSAAAISCAEAGLRVAIIEREAFPRHRPGETLHPGIEPLLQKLGVLEEVLAAGFIRHSGHWIEWGATRKFEAFGSDENGEWLGFQAYRAVFDTILLEHARKLGVTIFQPCQAISPLVSEGSVIGIKTSDREIFCNVVIDAAGGSHWLARQLNLPLINFSSQILVRYGYANGQLREPSPIIKGNSFGWNWFAQVQPDIVQWTNLSFSNWEKDEYWMPEEIRYLSQSGTTRGADMTWRMVNECAGVGYFLIGDAACVLDPASSHGVLRSLMSGMMAAYLIVKFTKAERPDNADMMNVYRDWMSNWFQIDVARLEDFYQSLGAINLLKQNNQVSLTN
jgi:flavin-dependent dehydrogenase